MAVHVTCPKCRKQVPFGKLFCTFCGAKLEINPDTVNSRVTAGEVIVRARRILVRLASLALIAGAVGMFLWPVKPTGRVGDATYAKLCQQRIDAVRARVLNGMIFTETFSDLEINAWLSERVAKLTSAEAGSGFQLQEVNVALKKGLVVVNTRLARSAIDLTFEVEGKPRVTANSGFEFEVTGVRIGHVPMPSFAHAHFADSALNVFSELREQKELLNKMKRLEVTDSQVIMSTQNQ